MEFKINNNMYSIRHYEPLTIIKGVNYGMGHHYDICIFDKEKEHYVKIKTE